MKRPAFMFYPGDWLRNIRLRTCSIAARGLWMDMLCLMHQGEPYGHLALGIQKDPAGDANEDVLRAILPANLARMVGSTEKEVSGLLRELEEAGAFSRTADGTIYSRRMVRDEKLRQVRAMGGSKSLQNPRVPRPKDMRKDTFRPSSDPPFGVSPSYSFSYSSSKDDDVARNEAGKLSATDVAIALCQQNGWTSKDVASALQDAIVHQAKVMSDAELEQVGEWLVATWYEHKEQNGQFAGSVRNFFAEAKYAEGPRPEVIDHKSLPPHLRVRKELRRSDDTDPKGEPQ